MPDDALKVGAIDAVVAPDALQSAALQMIKDAIAGKLDWQSRRAAKKAPLRLSKTGSHDELHHRRRHGCRRGGQTLSGADDCGENRRGRRRYGP